MATCISRILILQHSLNHSSFGEQYTCIEAQCTLPLYSYNTCLHYYSVPYPCTLTIHAYTTTVYPTLVLLSYIHTLLQCSLPLYSYHTCLHYFSVPYPCTLTIHAYTTTVHPTLVLLVCMLTLLTSACTFCFVPLLILTYILNTMYLVHHTLELLLANNP